jgi:hypothetical protein
LIALSEERSGAGVRHLLNSILWNNRLCIICGGAGAVYPGRGCREIDDEQRLVGKFGKPFAVERGTRGQGRGQSDL